MGRPTPDLAQRWEISPDGRRYSFHLRHGVTFGIYDVVRRDTVSVAT